MGDLDTLRTAQAAVAVCVFLLLSLGTYRPTHSAFAAWWSGVVAASAMGTLAYVVGEGSTATAAAVIGNGASVLGASFAWGAARSLRGLRVRWWFLAGPAVATGLATWWERPEGNSWPAGASLLAAMAAMLGLSAAELVAEYRTNVRGGRVDRRAETGPAIATLMVASVLASAFYVVRLVTFLSVGPDSDFYRDWVGPFTTTFLIMLMLVVVSYTVTALSHYEMALAWRAKASTDDLTGLLHRSAFVERVENLMRDRTDGGAVAAVIVADIDHFKDVNDVYGHSYGDAVLAGYSQAIRTVLGDGDLAARFGGEEFVVFLNDADADRAIKVTGAINDTFIDSADPDRHIPTVSYGVAVIQDHMSLHETIQLADDALYRAKRAGRARVVAHQDGDL